MRVASNRPLGPRPQRVPPAAATPTRRKLERYSVRPLVILKSLPGWLLPMAMGVFLLLGLLVPGRLAGAFLLVLAAFLGWLLALSWPALTTGSKVIRLAVNLMVLVAAGWRFAGYG